MLLPDSPRPHLKVSVVGHENRFNKFTINHTEGSDTVATLRSWCLLIKVFLQMLDCGAVVFFIFIVNILYIHCFLYIHC